MKPLHNHLVIKPSFSDLSATGELFVQTIKRAYLRANSLCQHVFAADSTPEQFQFADLNQLYSAVIESSNDAIFTKTLAGMITSWNRGAERLYGYTVEEAVGQHIAMIVPDEHRQEIDDILERIRHGERVAHFETIRQRKDGRLCDVSLTVSPLLNAKKAVVGASVIARDITEHKEQEYQFRVAVESSPNGMVMIDANGTIVLANRKIETLFGYNRDELIGQSVDMLLPDILRIKHSLYRQQYIVDPLTRFMGVGRDLYGLRKDGTSFFIEVGLNPIETRNGLQILATIVDTTERRLAEDKLRYQASLIEQISDAIMTVDMNFAVTSWNHAAEMLYGWTTDEAIGQKIGDLLRTSYVNDNSRHVWEQFITEGFWRGEVKQYCKDGSERFILAAVTLMRDMHGKPNGMLAVNRDITERTRIQRELEAYARDLQRSNTELEQFAYVASHDLQEPLRMVASYTELLSERYRDQFDSRADKYMKYIVEGARRMQQLINDLLAFSRVGTQGKPLQSVDSAAIVRRVLTIMQQTIRENSATIELGELPVIEADLSQIGQIFQNLISNAIKFHSDAPPHIRIAATQADDRWVFSVSDNGIGIKKEYAERIFQIFQRLHDRTQYEGNGIGLAIAKRIVERHDGTIWFESQPGKGTTFYFTIPITKEKAVDMPNAFRRE